MLRFLEPFLACSERLARPALAILLFLTASIPTLAGDIELVEEFVASYCLDCHNADDATQNLDLETTPFSQTDWLYNDSPQDSPQARWELSLKRIASRQMPPPDADRPGEEAFAEVTAAMGRLLDKVSEQQGQIPNIDALRRLTRTEYENSIRDLLDVQIDASRWIPMDESSQGFDNITVGELSPALMSRYLTAAEQISRLAVGRQTGIPIGLTVRLPADLTQEKHLAGLPLGTRGGTNIRHTFAESGVYELAVRLTRDRDEMVEGLSREHDLDILIDRDLRHRFRIKPPADGKDYTHVDTNLKVRLHIEAGPHDVAVTFPSQGESLIEIKRQPFDASYNRHRHPRQQPAIFEVSVVGPLTDDSADNQSTESNPARLIDGVNLQQRVSPSRQHVFSPDPDMLLAIASIGNADDGSDVPSQQEQLASATRMLRPLLRRAFRRDVQEEDLEVPLAFVREAIETEITTSSTAKVHTDWRPRFELGIERAIASILVNPHFLFRIEGTETSSGESSVQRISDAELATRLSFFLWSSLPDDELLDLAMAGDLHQPHVLAEQVDRMLADPRSDSLVENFASQWLYLRNLEGITPDLRSFPDYDENLRMAFRQETESLFRHILRSDESVLGLIQSDFTFLNERLAKHYGIPGVIGSHFRRVQLPGNSHRGGILRHGSILAVTSYSTRTSPTIRGNWVLENIVGTPPPPPPPDVPTLKEKSSFVATTFRDRLAQHRENPACASCHALIDPVGFALDNYDAVGRWRTHDQEDAIDSSGVLPDGTEVSGVEDLEASLMNNPNQFVHCLTEKLMTFGLGRGVDHRDASEIRKIVHQASKTDYPFSSVVQGIVASKPFQYRSHTGENP